MTGDDSEQEPREPRRTDERLDSWKEIATYFGKAVTTVQRWAKDEGLPIHRHAHLKKGSVFAWKRELDAWRETRTQLTAPTETTTAAPVASGRAMSSRAVAITGAATLAAMLLGAAWWRRPVERAEPAAIFPAPRLLATVNAPDVTAAISPDGRFVVYRTSGPDNFRMVIRDLRDGTERPVGPGVHGSPLYATWSPRGDLISFLTGAGPDRFDLSIVAVTGGAAKRVTEIAGIGTCWERDGQALAFADRNSEGEPFSIFSVDLESGARRRLTTPALGTFGDTHCAFSPDGRTLAVGRFATRYQSDLFVTEVPESPTHPARRLTTNFVGAEGLTWTPDGHALVAGSHVGLWTIPVAGGRPEAIGAERRSRVSPSFSRPAAGADARFVFVQPNLDVNLRAWRGPADSEVNLTADSGAWEDNPALSPDGRLLAFTSNRTGNNELWVANADGTRLHRLTFHDGPLVASPSWSPNGNEIAFTSQVAGNHDVYIIRKDGSQSRRLTTEPSQEQNPTWSRDGRWVYFKSDRSGVGRIWKAAASGGPAVPVTAGEGSQARESPDGTLLYFVRGATAPGLWSMPVRGGDEKIAVEQVREGLWDLVDKGIVFRVPADDPSPHHAVVRLFEFASGKTSTLFEVAPFAEIVTGLTASRDLGAVIWAGADFGGNDVMVVDRWPY